MKTQIILTDENMQVYLMTHPWIFWVIIFIIIWSIIWKGLALWKASKNNHLLIFIIILILNTLGIFEIIYLTYMHFKNKKEALINPIATSHFAPPKNPNLP